ncbi:MAG: M67 family metallopeptidase [Chloroflexota bacterium]|nr:M67 family metallopeptidase [Chloroflexota bacterium]
MTAHDTRPEAEDWRAAAVTGTTLRDTAKRAAGHGPRPAALRRDLHRELVEWALGGQPNEACGLLAGASPAAAGGAATRFLPLRNAAESPYRYLIDPQEQLAAMLELDDRDEVVWGIFHSHVASPAEPSVTDLGLAFYPDSLYLICSLAGDEPHVRAWTLAKGQATEVPLQLVD